MLYCFTSKGFLCTLLFMNYCHRIGVNISELGGPKSSCLINLAWVLALCELLRSKDNGSSDTISAITISNCIKLCVTLYIQSHHTHNSCRFNEMQDTNNMALFLFHTAMRWAAVRLDTLSLMVVFATSLFVTFMPSDVIPPAYAALALSYAMNVSNSRVLSMCLGHCCAELLFSIKIWLMPDLIKKML